MREYLEVNSSRHHIILVVFGYKVRVGAHIERIPQEHGQYCQKMHFQAKAKPQDRHLRLAFSTNQEDQVINVIVAEAPK